MADHFSSAFDDLGVSFECALRCLETFDRDHEICWAEKGACDLTVIEVGAHELLRTLVSHISVCVLGGLE